jgi:glycosyltransferase involved in cell wall biosynthesis
VNAGAGFGGNVMPAPGVSVVIPAHNYGRYVGAAVESALSQAGRPVEVIVVDDGSTDDTPQVLQEYGKRIRVRRLDGRGVAAARNAGLAAAQGEYILFLDADDLLLPGSLHALAGSLDAHPAVDAVYGSWFYCDPAGGRAFIVRSPVRDGRVLPALFRGNIVHTPSAMMLRRRRLVEAGGFDDRLSFTTDWEMWLRLAVRGARFAAVPRPVAIYRVHAASMTRDLDRASRDVWSVLDRYLGDPTVDPALQAVRSGAYYSMGLYLAKLRLEAGDSAGAVTELRTALAHRPQRALSPDLYYSLSRAIRRHELRAGSPRPAAVLSRTRDLAERLSPAPAPAEVHTAVHLGTALMLRHNGEYWAALRTLAAAFRLSGRTVIARKHLPIIARIFLPPQVPRAIAALRGLPRQPLPDLVTAVMAEEAARRRAPAGAAAGPG